MAVETVFLIVLLFALVAGHFLLEITKPRKQEKIVVSGETQKLLMPSETISENQASPIIERLDRLEKMLLSSQNALDPEKFGGGKIENGLQKKLQSLVDFKNEMRIEAAALRDEISAIKEFIGMKENQKQPEPEIPTEKLHQLAFNARK